MAVAKKPAKKLTAKKSSVKNLSVKAAKAGAVKGGGGTRGCVMTFKATGQSAC